MNDCPTNTALEDCLAAAQEPPYASKELAEVGHMLNRYKIPFFYKQATLVHEQGRPKVVYVDFFLPTYNDLVIDCISDPKSREYQSKKRIYRQNQISVVQITPENLKNPGWQKNLYEIMEKHYRQPLNGTASFKL